MEKSEKKYNSVSCPQCSSDDTSSHEHDADDSEGKGIKLFGIPLTPPVKTYQCGKCNHTWEDRNLGLNIMSLVMVIFFILYIIFLVLES